MFLDFYISSDLMTYIYGFVLISIIIWMVILFLKRQYKKTTKIIQSYLKIGNWLFMNEDDCVVCKTTRAVNEYTSFKYLNDKNNRVKKVYDTLQNKKNYKNDLLSIIETKQFKNLPLYFIVKRDIKKNLQFLDTYNVCVVFESTIGRDLNSKTIHITLEEVENFYQNSYGSKTKNEIKNDLNKKDHP